MHNVQVTPLIGLPQLDGWSHVSQSQDSRLIWTLSLSGSHARNVGRDILDTISNSDSSGLQTSLPTTAADFYDLFQSVIRAAMDKDVQLSCAAVFFEDAQATFAVYHAQILLKRGQKVGTLLDGLHTSKVIQGKFLPDDVVILTTARAVTFVDEIKLKFQQGYDSDSVVASLTPSLQLEENTSRAAIAFISQGKHFEDVAEETDFSGPAKLSRSTEVTGPTDFSLSNGFRESTDQDDQDRSELSDPAADLVAEDDLAESGLVAAEGVDQTADQTADETASAIPEQAWQSVQSETINSGNQFETDSKQLHSTKRSDHPTLVAVQPDPQLNNQAELDQNRDILIDTTAVTAKLSHLFKSLTASLVSKLRPFFTQQLPQLVKTMPSTSLRAAKGTRVLSRRAFVALVNLWRRLRAKDVYLSGTNPRQFARYLVVGVMLVVLVAGSGGWWYFQRQQQLSQVAADLQPLQAQLTQAADTAGEQPIQARDQLLTVLDQVAALEQKYQNSRLAQTRIAEMKSQVESLYQEVAGRKEVQELPIFFDLSTIQDSFIASKATLTGNQAWFLDNQAGQAMAFNIVSKEGRVFSLDQVKSATEDSINLLSTLPQTENSQSAPALVSAGELLFSVSAQDGSVAELAEVTQLAATTLLAQFGDNVYAFNPQAQNLYRIGLEDGELGDPSGWVRSSQGLEYGRVTSLTIDGDIWLADRAGKIVRMRSGRPVEFSVTGLEDPFSSGLIIFTQEDFEFLYVLESAKNRLVVLDKDGQFVKEIVSASLASVTSIIVSADESTVLAISGSLLYQLGV